MNAITAIQPLAYSDIEHLAVSIAKSGLFGIKTPDQAITLMMIAQAEGRHPALAARDYDIIQGRPAKKAEAMLRDFLQAGGKVEWHTLSDSEAAATFSHPQGGSARIDWDMPRAAQAQLGARENWKKFPRQMLRSRVVSEGVRTIWPSATSGMYVPEEVADMPATPAFAGTTIDHAEPEPKPDPEATPPRKRTVGEWLDTLEAKLQAAETTEDVDSLTGSDEVRQAQTALRNGALERLNSMVSTALARVNGPAPEYPHDERTNAEADELHLP